MTHLGYNIEKYIGEQISSQHPKPLQILKAKAEQMP